MADISRRRWARLLVLAAALGVVAAVAPAIPVAAGVRAASQVEPAACSGLTRPPTGTLRGAMDHNGLHRTYLVHVPPGYDPTVRTPVVLLFHGQGSYALQQLLYSDFGRLADRQGFLVVAPDTAYPEYNQWLIDAGIGATPNVAPSVDDLGFTTRLLDRVERRYCVDPDRVHASGISSGAFFVSRVACRLSDRIASVAPVAGTVFFDDTTGDCGHDRPVPVLAFHGSADVNVPFASQTGGRDGPDDGVLAQVRRWAIGRNGCSGSSTVRPLASDVSARTWECPAAGATRLVRIEGGGHTWPGAPFEVPSNGRTTQSVSATALAWRFFVRHPRQ